MHMSNLQYRSRVKGCISVENAYSCNLRTCCKRKQCHKIMLEVLLSMWKVSDFVPPKNCSLVIILLELNLRYQNGITVAPTGLKGLKRFKKIRLNNKTFLASYIRIIIALLHLPDVMMSTDGKRDITYRMPQSKPVMQFHIR